MKVIRIITLTDAGQLLAQRLMPQLVGKKVCLSHKPQPFSDTVQQAFNEGEQLIFICATGIVVRTLAPVLVSKQQDPAVLVLDEQGQFVIPLLSGHEGGANELAAQVATGLEAQLVSTTANPYLRPYYIIGMGCERGCSMEALQQLLEDSLHKIGIELSDVAQLTSITLKADEVGLIELAQKIGVDYHCFSADELSQVESQLQTPSRYVYETVGVYGVAESAALYSAQLVAGTRAELVLPKQKSKVATCAIARIYLDSV